MFSSVYLCRRRWHCRWNRVCTCRQSVPEGCSILHCRRTRQPVKALRTHWCLQKGRKRTHSAVMSLVAMFYVQLFNYAIHGHHWEKSRLASTLSHRRWREAAANLANSSFSNISRMCSNDHTLNLHCLLITSPSSIRFAQRTSELRWWLTTYTALQLCASNCCCCCYCWLRC